MAYDLLIKNGVVIDGTGHPRYAANIGVVDGRIAEIGNKIDGTARKVIDASDLIVAPGFIDPHTHYDAQICWDPLLSCSSWHGVTTVVMGNCGVGIAPCRPDLHEVVTWDLVNVEGIPFEVLSRGIEWGWVSFPEFMQAAEQRRSGVNLTFLAPLTPFRHFVMGEESMERAATAGELAQIKTLLREALLAGAAGFSTTNTLQHVGYRGRPLACRLADINEMTAYARVLKELGRGLIEIALTRSAGILSDEEYQLLDLLLTESGRPVTWLSARSEETLRKAEPLIKRGGICQLRCTPTVFQFNLKSPALLMAALSPTWTKVFNLPAEAQKKLYASDDFRRGFAADLKTPRAGRLDWTRFMIDQVTSPSLKVYEGKSVAEVAHERGEEPLACFLNIAIEDELQTWFVITFAEEERISRFVADSRLIIGLSDGGAHVGEHCDANYPTYLLGTWSRDKQLLTLEHAVKRLTSEPADLFGIADRGRLADGMAADFTIFDYNTINSAPRQHAVRDLPGGGLRFVTAAQGIEYTIVNGEVLFEHQRHTGALPGTVLRAGN
ncbi:MAG: amidohydrolase family protein [Deltaproteobacteria bacterium]|nr:amidohydrolase family protein [Deltaproteobacteria bacterium]